MTLHDLIEEMGKEIVRNESKDPGKRSRLWFREDIVDVLEDNKGTSQIEIIHMDSGNFKEVEWDGNAFKEMKNLKTLIINKGWNDIFSTGPKYLPNSLRVLEWWGYPSQDFPKDFYPKKLAICNLVGSKCTSSVFVTLFGKKFANLTSLNFYSCKYLTGIPDVSGLKGLKKLSFASCYNLLTVHESVGLLEKLRILKTGYCGSLQEILGIPPNLKRFSAEGCYSLTSSCKSMLLSQELHEAGYTNFCLPGAEIPEWFEYPSRGVPISFRVRKELPAITICFHMASFDDYSLLQYEGENKLDYEYLYRLEDGLMYSISKYLDDLLPGTGSLILIINGNEHDCFTFSMDSVDTYLFDLREILRTEDADLRVKPKERTEDKLNEALSKQEWINVQIIYKCDGKRILMKSGIHVLKEQSRDDIHFIDDLNSSDTESENMKVAEAKTLYWSYNSVDSDVDSDDYDDIYELPKKSRFTSPELGGFLSKKKFKNLTNLNFDQCQCLTEIPDVSFLQQLENLSFQQCCNLLTIHESVGSMEKLKILKARCCCKLTSFPPIKLTSLEQLDLALCHHLESFPEISVKMEKITKLNLDGTRINLTGLQQLEDTSSCRDAAIFLRDISMRPKEDESVEKVSSTMSSNIQHLSLRNCNLSDEFFPIALQWFANVKELDLSENNFTVIPESIKECCFLTKLTLERCSYLQEIRGLPPNLKHFSARECLSLTSSSRSMLLEQELHEAGNTNFYLPGADIPEWFGYQTWAQSISFGFHKEFPAIAICLVREDEDEDEVYVDLTVITNGHTYYSYWESMGKGTTRLLDLQEFKFNFGEPPLGNGWYDAEITYRRSYKNDKSFLVKSGIHGLKQQSSVEDNEFIDPQIKRKLKSQNQQLMKKQRLVDMEVADTTLNSACFLWKSIPSSIKENQLEVTAVWKIGQKLWLRDYAAVHEAIRGCDWSQELQGLVAAFSGWKRSIQRL